MRLRHIEVIQALLQTGNLGTAAELLQLPAATVSATLQDAEQQLGFLLFASVRGRMQATRETRELQPLLHRLYAEVEPLRRLAGSLRQHQDPALRVVCTPTLAQQLLPQSLAALRRRFRETPCTLASQHTRGDRPRSAAQGGRTGPEPAQPRSSADPRPGTGRGQAAIARAPRLAATQTEIHRPAGVGRAINGRPGRAGHPEPDARQQAAGPAAGAPGADAGADLPDDAQHGRSRRRLGDCRPVHGRRGPGLAGWMSARCHRPSALPCTP